MYISAWMTQISTVRYRVYSWIFLCPVCPSWRSFFNEGTTSPRSIRMIDAVIYGMIPSPNRLLWLRVPPVKICRYSAALPKGLSVSRVRPAPGSLL